MELIKKNNIDLTVWKITFINVRIIFSPNDYKKWGKHYLEKNDTLHNWNLKTLVHLVPFIFGFSNMIWSRYQDQTIPSLFEHTLPGKKLLKEEMAWETFQFIKKQSLDFKNLKQVDLYSNYCLFQIEKYPKEKIIGIFLPTQKINWEQGKNPSLSFGSSKNAFLVADNEYSNKTLLHKIHDLYYNIDEIPKKIENLKIFHEQKKIKSIFTIELNKIFQNSITRTDEINYQFDLNKSKVYIPKTFPNFETGYNKSLFVKGVKLKKINPNTKTDTYLKKRIEKVQKNKKRKFQNELNFFFYKQGYQTTNFIKNSCEETFIFSFPNYSANQTLQILNDFLQIKPINLDSGKFLSGYYYPDLARKKVYEIGLNSIFNRSNKKFYYKIAFPAPFIISYNDNSLLNLNCSNLFPISDRKSRFLGINIQVDNEKISLQNKNYLSKEYIFSQNKNFTPFDTNNDSDSNLSFLSIEQKDIPKAINLEESSFLKILQKKELFKHENSFFQKIKSQYHFPIFSETLLLEQTKTFKKLGDLSSRTPSLLNSLKKKENILKQTNFNFFESWEPISVHSWMVITQFSTGLFLIHLVKDLYKDYGKELIEYLLQFANSSNIDIEELKEQYLYDDPEYRLIRKIKKSFKNVAGIDNLLLQLGEIVWFLRNKGRSAKLKNSIPSGILLTGPPGTGKTLLVQAIAGEAQVPIIVESGSLLTDPQQKGKGIERLKKIFAQARKLAPCIIFIDEVDTLGEKRQNIIQTPMGSDELIESIYEKSSRENKTQFIPKPLNLDDDKKSDEDLEYQLFRGETDNVLQTNNEKINQKAEAKKTRLSLLTQFLVEMDGLKQRNGVIVIGATNRPNVLDPALIRPGRFDQILNLELPGKQKRIEILQLYGKKLQVETNFSWEYLANRTKGFSAADIASAMNESTIQAIIAKTNHTIETIEKGIDLVTSYASDSNEVNLKKKITDPFFLSRLAYYQAGKGILQVFLDDHPPIVVLHLLPRPKNARHGKLYENSFSELTTRKKIEAQLIGLYAGKASELLPLYGNKISTSLKRWHSDFGKDDLVSATFLANLVVDKWYFNSLQVLIRKNNSILKTRNEIELIDSEKIQLSTYLETEIEDEIEIEKIAKLSRLGRYQQRGFGPWWQIQVAKQTSEIEGFFADWYRIYIPDPEETPLNLEWIPPDEYYHTNNSLKKLSTKSNLSFNDLYQIERDYVFHGLILNSFNTAFYLVDEKREFLDYFSDYLLRFEILRENEIINILNTHEKDSENLKNISKITKTENTFLSKKENFSTIDNFWGNNSRRKNSRFLKIESKNFINRKSYQSPFFEH